MSRIWARRYAGQEVDAEDIAQEALLRAWRAQGSLHAEESFNGWLQTIVRREAIRALSQPPPLPMAVDEDLAVEDEALLAILDRAEVAELMRVLDDHERELLRLRYGLDLTQPAIARQLGLPEGTVKVRLHRARAKLRKALEA